MKNQDITLVDSPVTTGILSHIEEGMKVIDAEGHKIGTIKSVYFGDETDAKPGPETVTGSHLIQRNSFVEDMTQAFTGEDELPQTVQAQLIRHGFVRIDRGLLRRDAVAMPDNILQVSGDEVTLNVFVKELFEL